jgi:arsenite oxidase large subunit
MPSSSHALRTAGHSDIYPVEPINTEFADIVLPAAARGEHDATRANGERRLRLYSKFYDWKR